MGEDFVHLHVHSDYSALDGAGRVKDYAQQAALLGMPALTLSDHGNMFGAYEFYRECLSADIKPIIGEEFYVAPDTLDRKEAVFWGTADQRSEDVGASGAATHLTVLAVSASGLRNLYRLHHLSYTRGFYRKPRIDVDSLATYHDGLVVLTGCAGSAINTRIRLGQEYEARLEADRLCDAVGRDNVFVEIMDHENPVDSVLNPALVRLASDRGLPLVATNDSHYVAVEDARYHDALLCLQTRSRLADDNRFRFEGRGYHLRTRKEMDALRLPREALDNTLLVAERVESYAEVIARQDLSRMAVAPRVEDADSELWMLCMAWLAESPHAYDPTYFDRLKDELDVIAQMGFSHYFLVLGIICGWARANGIRIGPGRGSAAGCLVAHATGITQLDPIEYGLLFERFLNPERSGFPDIDIDVDDLQRPRLLAFIRETFGVDNVAQIITFSKIGAKRALLDSAFVSGLPTKIGRDLTTRLPKAQYGRAPSLAEGDWSALDQTEADVVALAEGVEGLIRQPGIHAAGVVISSRPVIDSQPVWQPPKVDGLVTGFDMNAQEPLGLVKFDLLGLINLRIIDGCLTMLRETQQMAQLDVPYTFDDQRTFDLLASGSTLGVFQLDSPGMRGLLRKVQPTRLDDIAAVLALYRPGPMGADSHNNYARRKNSGHSWKHEWTIHRDMEETLRPLLGDTYGLIVYQEQVMRILVEVGGYSMTAASTMLKVFKFKDRERLAKEHDRFLEGGSARGFSHESLERLWDIIVPFADYAFNKSHSFGYGIISYWTAWLKANHPMEYMSALLGASVDDPNSLSEYFTECARMGIKLLAPDVNESGLGFTPTREGIRYGLAGIKGVGDKVCAAIISKRPYTSSADFFRRVPKTALNIRVLEALIKSGAMDGLGQREGWLQAASSYAERAIDERAKKTAGQRSVLQSRYTIARPPVLSKRRQKDELDVLGVAITQLPIRLGLSRPLDGWEIEYIHRVTQQYPGDQKVTLQIGKITLTNLTSLTLTGGAKRALESLGGLEVKEVDC